MYDTDWNKSKGLASESFVEFVEELERELNEFEGKMTVKDVKGKIGVKIKIYTEDEPRSIFNLVEDIAKDTLGTENYVAWTSGDSMTVTV